MGKNFVGEHITGVVVVFSLIQVSMAAPPQFKSDTDAWDYCIANEIVVFLDDNEQHIEQVWFYDDTPNIDGLLLRLQGCRHIRRFDFNENTATPERLRYAIENWDIREIGIEDSSLTVDVYKELQRAPKLRRLHCSFRGAVAEGSTSDKLALVGSLSGLRLLSLSKSTFNDLQFGFLPSLTKLESVILDQTDVNDDQLRHVGQLKKLTRLNLAYTKVTDAGVKHLEDLHKLEYLCLWDNPGITDKCAPSLLNLRSLDDLEIMDTEIGDETLRVLAKHPALRKLHIAGTWVTDEGLMALAELQSLKYLNVEVTEVTPAAVDRLQRAVPHCRIVTNPPESMGMGRER